MSRLTGLLQPLGEMLKNDFHALVLRLTALFILLHGFTDVDARLSNILIKCVCMLMLLNRTFLLRWELWAGLLIVMLWMLVPYWFLLDNNHFLVVYWCLACALAVHAEDSGEYLRRNGRLLVGLPFLFAFGWKLFNREYFDGSFFFDTLLMDGRLNGVAVFLGGLDAGQISDNARRVEELLFYPGSNSYASLTGNAVLNRLARFLCYWTLLIEGATAITFLLIKSPSLSRVRHIPLITFLCTTYVFAPVPRFSTVLAIMGLAQSAEESLRVKAIYLAIIFLTQFTILAPRLNDYLLKSGSIW